MKILYAIQGTGNGHISRGRSIIPILQSKGELDILISGIQADVDLEYPVKYKFTGLSFIFGKKGGVDVLATYRKNNLKRLWREIQQLPVEDYDIIINDFEPVSAWACYFKKKPCVSLSHQAAVLNTNAPQPKDKDRVGLTILKYYAPVTEKFGFHFKEYGEHIFTPVIRDEIRKLPISNTGHYTVYLPAYSDERIIKVLSMFGNIRWEVYSKHNKKPISEGKINIYPISNEAFSKSIAAAEGVLCGAGFETPAEVMFLKKKLMVIPMKGQYEQQCNAAALKKMGIPVIKSLKKKHKEKIATWLDSRTVIPVTYADHTASIIDMVIDHYPKTANSEVYKNPVESPKTLKDYIIKKILSQPTG